MLSSDCDLLDDGELINVKEQVQFPQRFQLKKKYQSGDFVVIFTRINRKKEDENYEKNLEFIIRNSKIINK